MFVLCCKKTVVDRKRHEKDEKRINTEQKWIKGENQGISKKKNPTWGMDVCVLFVVRTVI
jgi:hypothetical protein